jgi:hypothetical protein
VNLHAIEQPQLREQRRVDGVESPRHRCFHTGNMRVAQSAVVCACGAADWNAAAVEAKQKAIEARIVGLTAAVTAASVTRPVRAV